MPYSDPESRGWVRAAVARMPVPPRRVLDVGAGSGTWEDTLRPILPLSKFTAIEIFEPYIDQFFLNDIYDEVIVADVRDIELPEADLIVMGDVLEHLPVHDAVELWCRSLSAGAAVVAVIPLGEYRQGACYGNDHEAHLATWEHEDVLRRLPGVIAHETLSVVGVYFAGTGWGTEGA